jgi:hypothetical protein
MKEIPLTQGQVALVDDADYEELSKYKWQAIRDRHSQGFYAARFDTVGKPINGKKQRKMIQMHRAIMGAVLGEKVDHIHHNTLDNRRPELRKCTNAENQQNSQKRHGCISQFKGVTWHKGHRSWYVEVQKGSYRYRRGGFPSERDAALAYDAKARELFGEFALTNF